MMAKKSSGAADSSRKSSDEKAARKQFKEGLLIRGEAVSLEKKRGKMPAGATHVIEGKESDGTPKVKRIRFSLTGSDQCED